MKCFRNLKAQKLDKLQNELYRKTLFWALGLVILLTCSGEGGGIYKNKPTKFGFSIAIGQTLDQSRIWQIILEFQKENIKVFHFNVCERNNLSWVLGDRMF